MCFSPKIKTPKIDTERAPEPAPLTQEVTGVEFGGSDSGSSTGGTETTGRESLKVERTGSGQMKSSIRKSMFGGKK